MKRAIISVSDKTGIIDLAKELIQLGIEIISTGGTAKVLKDAEITVREIEEITEFPECLDGRVKTLHPKIHAGILAIRNNEEHMQKLAELNILPIDIIIVNLYPFKQTILKENSTLEESIENIDIGGPTMIRAAAKNYADVAVVVDPNDYTKLIDELKESGNISIETKFNLAAKVFEHTSHYDTLIANYLRKKAQTELFPQTLTLTYEKVQNMRYGENPHQQACFYKEIENSKGALTNAIQLHGKELSFNNINDTNGALELLREFNEPTVVACKHANPCGVGSAQDIYNAYMKAFDADPVSIYGGIIVCNGELDELTAAKLNEIFVEIVVAPSFTNDALTILKQKKNIRILKLEHITEKDSEDTLNIKKVSGGILVQTIDSVLLHNEHYEIATKRSPTDKEIEDMLFTWKIVKYVKSNGIAIGKNKQLIGAGGGQTNRIWACKQAIEHGLDNFGLEHLKNSVLASDAYFPFPDCVEEANKAGITAIIQPGGSIRDRESIELCDKYNMSMIFTKMRHFRH